jgi:hypothetical protein
VSVEALGVQQVGRNWDKVYSGIKSVFPNTNKQNHHMLDTHLLHEVERSVTVDKSRKGRRVCVMSPYSGKRELRFSELHIDPTTNLAWHPELVGTRATDVDKSPCDCRKSPRRRTDFCARV